MVITLQNLITRIEQADAVEINTIAYALTQRYAVLHPDWEMTILTLPKKDSAERCRIFTRILEYEQMRREGQ